MAGHTASTPRPLLAVAPIPLDPTTNLPVIQKVFIANRGEIACRVIATCKKLQIRTVVTYVKEDELSRHVIEADEAIFLGSIETHSVNPFLNIDLLVQTALENGAQAVHPGYGYLSENAEFAQKVRDAGLLFVGPSPSAMSTLGDKRSSKKYLLERAPDVPLIPGFTGTSVNGEDLKKAAVDIGFPIMLKASAGGGGKGMRIVRRESQLVEELARVQSEASRSFGSSDVILEKYVESSKHVEIQILGDKYGNVFSFFERDCSVQRRHQKVIEESPCVFLTDEARKKMGATAVRIAKLIGYENAGTVEFVVDVKTSQFFFLEVNARLQVEHPITEETTGVDLVALQLFVAAGGNMESLSFLEQVKQTGHAIECRLCAENPDRDFFPENGTIHVWQPAGGALGPGRDIRYETALQSGSSVSIYFDSMIAKLVVWAPTREQAIQKMVAVLRNTACIGVKSNQHFLQQCLLRPEFRDLKYNTSFIPGLLDQLLRKDTQLKLLPELSLVPSFLLRHLRYLEENPSAPKRPFTEVRRYFRNQTHDPVNVPCEIVQNDWLGSSTDAGHDISQDRLCIWKTPTTRSDSPVYQAVIASLDQIITAQPTDKPTTGESAAKAITDQYNSISSYLRRMGNSSTPDVDIHVIKWQSSTDLSVSSNALVSGILEISLNGNKLLAYCVIPGGPDDPDRSRIIYCHFPLVGTFIRFQRDALLSYIESSRSTVEAQKAVHGDFKAPMPCTVLSTHKAEGDEVEKGDLVMVIESMKMEVSLRAGKTGKFKVNRKGGDSVTEGEVLYSIM